MVASGIFSGTIMLITLFYIVGTSLSMLDNSYNLLDTNNIVQELDNVITETEIGIDSITVTGNSQIVDTSIQNVGNIKLSDFDKFTIIATYDADIGGVKTKVSETFQYDEDASFPTSLGSTQLATPEYDVSKGNWDDSIGGDNDNNLFDEVNEIIRSDVNYASSDSLTILGQTDVWETGLSPVDDPLNDNEHIVRYVYRKDSGLGIDMDLHVSLLQGTSTIANWSHSNIGEVFTQSTNTLTTTQAASITDYSDLRLKFTAEYSGGILPGKAAHISWANLEVPNADCARNLSEGRWMIKNIDSDSVDPRLLNSDETANICLELSYPLYDDGMIILVVSTDRGVTSMKATSWT